MFIQKLSIVIPVFNEGKTIQLILDHIVQLELVNGIEKEIIVVNDNSQDETNDKIEQFIIDHPKVAIQYFRQQINKGKGAALHVGFKNASGDYVIVQDADLELFPDDINRLLKVVLNDDANVVYGSRFLEKKYKNVNFIWHIVGNSFLTRFTNLLTGLRLTDMMTCYKLIPLSIISKLELKESRFGFEPEITVKLSKMKNVLIKEVPISFFARTKEKGKKINYKDGFRVLFCVIKYSFFKKRD